MIFMDIILSASMPRPCESSSFALIPEHVDNESTKQDLPREGHGGHGVMGVMEVISYTDYLDLATKQDLLHWRGL